MKAHVYCCFARKNSEFAQTVFIYDGGTRTKRFWKRYKQPTIMAMHTTRWLYIAFYMFFFLSFHKTPNGYMLAATICTPPHTPYNTIIIHLFNSEHVVKTFLYCFLASAPSWVQYINKIKYKPIWMDGLWHGRRVEQTRSVLYKRFIRKMK